MRQNTTPSATAMAAMLPRVHQNAAWFCRPRIDAQARRASELVEDTAAAADAWSRVDREIVNEAPLVPLYNTRDLVLLSRRVGNYEYHPFWNVLLDQLWVR